MDKLPLSVFIIAKNEARCIGEVIDSVRELADEVIVVDSGSSDDTCDIAEARGARVLFNEWPGYGQQKRFAEERCRNRWLLNLDADEVLSVELQQEISSLFATGAPSLPMYRIKVTSVYAFHRQPRFLSEYNSVIRLYDSEVARFPDHPTWDAITPERESDVGQLQALCLHYSSPNVGHYVDKFNRYTSLQADEQRLKPYWILVLRLLFAFPFDFLKAYLFKRHITGGLYGFVLAMSRAYSRFLKNAKMLEKHLQKRVEK
ncbi:MAG: glycosyltransferase family 2 protein [Candidatus Sedimenticola sp. (ex Thyasira tokunagai)]